MKEPNVIYLKNKKTGVVYAYEDHPYWDPEKKQSRSKRKILGKVDPLTGNVVPTRRRKAIESAEQSWEKPSSIDSSATIGKILIFLRLFLCETLAKRIISMVLISAGLPDNQVAELTGLSHKSTRELTKGLENGEVDKLFHVGGGGRKRKLIDLEESIIDEINKNNYHSQQQIADMIHDKYGIKVSLPVISRLLKKTKSNG